MNPSDSSNQRVSSTTRACRPPIVLEDYEGRLIRAKCGRALFGDHAPDPLKIGRFKLTGTLGRGGQGVVFRARDPKLGRDVALKLLASSPEHADQVLREAKTLAKVSHDNVVEIFDAGLDEEARPFIVMELIVGTDLGTWLCDGPRRWDEVVDKFISAGRGLAAVHQQDIVHRDFKPHNVLVSRGGGTKVVDFGIAISPAMEQTLDRPSASSLVGTPPYMAPEVLDGKIPDALGDQYSFCVALYEALYGQHPNGERVVPRCQQQEATNSATSSTRGFGVRGRVPRYFRTIIERGLSSEPAARYPEMSELLDALSRGPWWRRTGPQAAILVGFGAATAMVMSMTQPLVPPAACEDYASAVTEWGALRPKFVHTVDTVEPSSLRSLETADFILSHHAIWIDTAFAETCSVEAREATDLSSTYRRLECLEHNRGTLTDLFRAVSSADVNELVFIPDRLSALGGIDGCRVPRPTVESCDPWVVPDGYDEFSAAIDDKLGEATMVAIQGDYERALALGQDAIELASEPELRPRRARAHFERGRLAFDGERLDLAVTALAEARGLAEREGCDRLVAESLIWLSKAIVLQRDRNAAVADSWATLALDKLERVGAEGRALAAGLNAKGLVSNLAKGQPSEAEDYFRQSLEILERFPGQREAQLDRSHVLLNRGSTLARLGKLDEAILALERGIEIRTQLLGSTHPTLQKLYYQLGLRRLENEEYDEAKEMLNLALTVVQEGLPKSLRREGQIHHALAMLHERMRDVDTALVHARAANEAFEKVPDAGHLLRSDAIQSIGLLLSAKGRDEEALALLEQAREMVMKSPEATPRDQGVVSFKLGEVHARLRHWDQALALHREAVDLLRLTARRPGDDAYAYASFDLGEAHLQMNQASDAVAPLREAISIWEVMPGKAEMLALSRWLLAKSHCIQGRRVEGQHLAQVALEYFQRNPQDEYNSQNISKISTWMSIHCSE